MDRMPGDSGSNTPKKNREADSPLVSAVITTHDRLDYLKRAVASVLNQTYKNMEYIVVNDNSGEDTYEYLEHLQQTRPDFVHIYINGEETRGGNHARNVGIQAAKGKYVALLDDDDEWLPEKTEKQLKLFKDGVGLVYCGKYLEHIDGIHDKWWEIEPVDIDYIGDLSKKCLKKIFCTTSAMMADREILIQAGGFDESINYWQETELCIRVCQITLVDAVEEPLFILRLNETDSKRLSNKYEGWVKAVEQINDKHRELIEALPADYKKERDLMTLLDSLDRQHRCGLISQRKMLYEIWKMTRNPKDLARFILNKKRLRKPKKVSLA